MADNLETGSDESTVAEQEPVQAIETQETEVTDSQESEQSESEEAGSESAGEPDVVYDIDGEEVNLKDIREWKLGHQRQSDYTKKTMEVATQRKALEGQKSNLDAQLASLNSVMTEIEAELLGDIAKVDWEELRDTNPSEYLRMKEVEGSKKGKLASLVKKHQEIQQAQIAEESKQLYQNAGWYAEDGSINEAKRDADFKQIQSYYKAKGISDAEFSTVTNHKLMLALLDAAKYHALQSKKPAVLSQVKEAPKVVSRPQKRDSVPAPKSPADVLFG